MSEPIHDENQKRSEATLGGLLRLRCCYCERVDIDDFASYPTNWTNIRKVNQEEIGIMETHRGVCPNCQLPDEDEDGADAPEDDLPPWEVTTPEAPKTESVHPIIKQIIDRDCHVATSAKEVVRHVISKLSKGYETLRAMPQTDRNQLVEQCIQHHRGNFKEYVEVMSGFTQTVGADSSKLPSSLSGAEIVRLMRKHKVTLLRFHLKFSVVDYSENGYLPQVLDQPILPVTHKQHRTIRRANCGTKQIAIVTVRIPLQSIGSFFISPMM